MGYVTNGTDVLSSLSRNDLWSQGSNLGNVQAVQGLLSQMALCSQSFSLLINDFLAFLFEFLIHFY